MFRVVSSFERQGRPTSCAREFDLTRLVVVSGRSPWEPPGVLLGAAPGGSCLPVFSVSFTTVFDLQVCLAQTDSSVAGDARVTTDRGLGFRNSVLSCSKRLGAASCMRTLTLGRPQARCRLDFSASLPSLTQLSCRDYHGPARWQSWARKCVLARNRSNISQNTIFVKCYYTQCGHVHS